MQRDDRRALQFHHVGLGRLSEVFIFIKGLMKGSLKKQLVGDICPTTLCWHLLGAAIELLQVTHHWGSFSIQSILNSGRQKRERDGETSCTCTRLIGWIHSRDSLIWLTASNSRNKSCHPHGTAAPCAACTPAAFQTACPNPRRGWVAPHRGPDMWTNWRWCRPRLLNGDVLHASPRGKECGAYDSVSFNYRPYVLHTSTYHK